MYDMNYTISKSISIILMNVKGEFAEFENAAKKIGLGINENKTKYMVSRRTERRDPYNFKRVRQLESPQIMM